MAGHDEASENEINFHLEEFKSLRSEIEARLKDSLMFAQYCLLGSAGVIAWLATTDPNKITPALFQAAWWIPFILCLFGSLRAYAMLSRIMEIAEYIRVIEKAFASKEIRGWEHFLERKRRSAKSNVLAGVSIVFWAAATVGAGLIGFLAMAR